MVQVVETRFNTHTFANKLIILYFFTIQMQISDHIHVSKCVSATCAKMVQVAHI